MTAQAKAPKPEAFTAPDAFAAVFRAAYKGAAADATAFKAEVAALTASAVDGIVPKDALRYYKAGYVAHVLSLGQSDKGIQKSLLMYERGATRPADWAKADTAARAALARRLRDGDLKTEESRGGQRAARPSANESDDADVVTGPATPAAKGAATPATPVGPALTVPTLVNKAEWLRHAQDLAAFMTSVQKKNAKAMPGQLRNAYKAFADAVAELAKAD